MSTSASQQEKYLRRDDFLSDLVIGMSDGLIVPFALAAGLSGAVSSSSIIVIAGISGIAAGSLAMGWGGYLAGKTEMDHYRSAMKEEHAETESPAGKEEVKKFFANLGLNEDMQAKAIEEIDKDKKQWTDLITEYEPGLDNPDPKRARRSALNIGLSYAFGGLVPLSPYFFTAIPAEALRVSAPVTLLCLFAFGFFKSRIMGLNPWSGALRVTIIGALAAGAAFGVACLFES